MHLIRHSDSKFRKTTKIILPKLQMMLPELRNSKIRLNKYASTLPQGFCLMNRQLQP